MGSQESMEWNTGMKYWNGFINVKKLINYFINSWISDTDY